MTRFRSFLRLLSALVMAVATTLTLVGASGSAVSADTGAAGTAPAPGYWVIGQYGGVWNFGSATPLGSINVTAPLVAAASTASGRGLWLADSNGRIYTLGDAVFHGDLSGLHLNKPVVGMSATKDGGGYWMVAGDGGVFTFGDAVFHGSLGSYRLNKPVVAMATTPDGGGYWMVASDGGIFTFGTAKFFGSEGSVHLNQPVIGMSPTADGQGYWLVATDGGVFTHGDAPFAGSLGSYHLNKPIMSMTPTSDNGGYWLIGADGGVFTFGDAPFVGSLGSNPPSQKVVFLAALPSGSSSQPIPTPVQSPPPHSITVTNGPSILAQQGVTWSGTVAQFQDQDPNAQFASNAALINWGDGHTDYGTVTGAGSITVSSSHAWASSGSYTVTVKLTDTSGATATASGLATVGGAIAGGHPDATVTLNEATAVPVNTVVGVFNDNSPSATASQFTASVDWRNMDLANPDQILAGTVVPVDSANTGRCVSTTTPCFMVLAQQPGTSSTYTYNDEGQYHPTVTVSDGGRPAVAISGPFTNTIDAIEGDATFTQGTPSFTEGSLGSQQILATFTDPGSMHDQGDNTNPAARNGHPNSPFSFSVNWGDGSPQCVYNWTNPPAQFSPNCSLIGLASSGMSIYGNHQYADEGNYTVTVTLTEFGYTGACVPALGSSSTCTLSYQVTAGEAESLTAATITATHGTAFTGQVASFSDTGSTDGPGAYTATINWGDGTIDTGTVGGTAGAITVSGSHTWANPNASQPVTVTLIQTGMSGSANPPPLNETANVS